MNGYNLRFHHLGLAVRSSDLPFQFLRGLGYLVDDCIEDPLQMVNLSLCHHPSMPAIEVIWPAGTSGPLTDLLSRSASMIYHICYETDSHEESVRRIVDDGLRIVCVSEPKPAVLFSGRSVSFYQVPQFGLIELLETSV